MERARGHISHLCYQNHGLPVAAAWAPVLAVQYSLSLWTDPSHGLQHSGTEFVCLCSCNLWAVTFPGGLLQRQDLQGGHKLPLGVRDKES